MPHISRAEALKRLRAQSDQAKPIIGAGAGTGKIISWLSLPVLIITSLVAA